MVGKWREFGNLLCKLRNERNWTQPKLLEEINSYEHNSYEYYAKSTISKWENGHSRPPKDVVKALECIFYGKVNGALLREAEYLDILPDTTKEQIPDLKEKLDEEKQADLIREHQSQIRELLEYWRKELMHAEHHPRSDKYDSEYEKMFPYLLQHCPLVDKKYQTFNMCKGRLDSISSGYRALSFDEHMYLWNEIESILMSNEVNLRLMLTLGWLDEVDKILDYGLESSESKLISYAMDYLLYYELNSFSDRKMPSHNWVANPLSLSIAKEDTNTYEDIVHFRADLISHFKNNKTIDNIRKKRQAYDMSIRIAYNELKNARHELYEAINTCIISHEYMRNKCDWCPPE